MAKYIGIDIGGTNIRVGMLDDNEEIIYLEKTSTLENVITHDELYNKIKNMVLKIPSLKEADYIGIGVPGAVRDNNILTCRNVPFLKNYPLAKSLEEDLKKKVYIENDAKVEALGVALKGEGKMYSNVCYITLSTGLGGGVTQSHYYFLDEVKQKFEEKAHSFARNTIIKICEVDEPGVIGAALIGKKH